LIIDEQRHYLARAYRSSIGGSTSAPPQASHPADGAHDSPSTVGAEQEPGECGRPVEDLWAATKSKLDNASAMRPCAVEASRFELHPAAAKRGDINGSGCAGSDDVLHKCVLHRKGGGTGSVNVASVAMQQRDVSTSKAAEMVAKMSSSVWSHRVQALVGLADLMRSESGVELTASLQKIAVLVLEKLADPHYKVVHAAMDCVIVLLLHFAHTIEQMIERWMPQLILRMQDTREATRA